MKTQVTKLNTRITKCQKYKLTKKGSKHNVIQISTKKQQQQQSLVVHTNRNGKSKENNRDKVSELAHTWKRPKGKKLQVQRNDVRMS